VSAVPARHIGIRLIARSSVVAAGVLIPDSFDRRPLPGPGSRRC